MKIAFQCSTLDKLLGGGIEPGIITELYGEAGSGKTNLCLQLARNVCREGKKVIYIDTEGISIERLQQICSDDFEQVLRNILLIKPHSFEEQEKIVDKVVRTAESEVKVGLVVLDSATVFYRMNGTRDEGASERKSLTTQITKLLLIARKKEIPVVVANQVYTDLEKNSFEPLGGHVLHHNAKAIIKLERIDRGRRRAIIMKHRSIAEGESAEFLLTSKGVES